MSNINEQAKDYTLVIREINKYIKSWGIYPKPKYIIENSNGMINTYNELTNTFYKKYQISSLLLACL